MSEVALGVLIGFCVGTVPSWLILRVNLLQLQEMRKIQTNTDELEPMLSTALEMNDGTV